MAPSRAAGPAAAGPVDGDWTFTVDDAPRATPGRSGRCRSPWSDSRLGELRTEFREKLRRKESEGPGGKSRCVEGSSPVASPRCSWSAWAASARPVARRAPRRRSSCFTPTTPTRPGAVRCSDPAGRFGHVDVRQPWPARQRGLRIRQLELRHQLPVEPSPGRRTRSTHRASTTSSASFIRRRCVDRCSSVPGPPRPQRRQRRSRRRRRSPHRRR